MPFRVKEVKKGKKTFYHVEVQGLDSKGKGAGDWHFFGPANNKEQAESLASDGKNREKELVRKLGKSQPKETKKKPPSK